MTLEQIRALVTADFDAVDRVIKQRLHSKVALVDQVATYIIYAGGKRLRPLLVLLASRACGHSEERHIDAAAIIEFIHTATLLHDDVVDESSLRRGRDTANEVFGNATSVLVGDFLYSRAFQMMVTLDRMRIMQILADATNAIAEGEVLQLMNAHDPNTTEARYIDVIRRKTARLRQHEGCLAVEDAVGEPIRRSVVRLKVHKFDLREMPRKEVYDIFPVVPPMAVKRIVGEANRLRARKVTRNRNDRGARGARQACQAGDGRLVVLDVL